MPPLLPVASFFLATTTATATYLYFLHRSLHQRVEHDSHHGTLPSSVAETITSIPPPVFTETYHTVHDHASTRVRKSLFPDRDPRELFTSLVRRNMTAFSKFPQAWILRFVVPSVERRTFRAAHIQSLDFERGDLVCGVYRVEERTPDKVVFAMMFKGPVGGRLVIRYTEDEDGETIVFHSETVMWTQRQPDGKRAKMPLESPVLRFLHEMASWWLLDSGVRYLSQQTGEMPGQK